MSLGFCSISTITHIVKSGKNPAVASRHHLESEIYGLKVVNLILPRSDHRLAKFQQIRNCYHPANAPVEGFQETVGIIGIIGFGLLLARFFSISGKRATLDKLSILWTSGILLAAVGGFAVLFAATVSPKIRCFNRISVFLALFGLLAVGFTLKNFKKTLPTWLWHSLICALFSWGIYDQVTPDFQKAQAAMTKDFYSDQHFFQKLEEISAPSTVILQLPYVPFPENPPVEKMEDYGHLRGYAHSNTLRWSYGTIKGRPESEAVERLSQLPLNLEQVRSAGYSGVYIDRTAFKDNAASLEETLSRQLGAQPLISENEKLSYFTL